MSSPQKYPTGCRTSPQQPSAFLTLGMPLEGFEEVGRERVSGWVWVVIVLYQAPKEDRIVGDPEKMRTELGFCPRHTFESLVEEMVLRDLALMTRRDP